MKFCALATMWFALAFGLTTVSGFLVETVVLTTPAKADIACGRLGCRETGRTLRRNGSYYRGLGLPASYNQINRTQPKANKRAAGQ